MKALILLLPVTCLAAFAAEPVPLPVAHAHNDYEHARPLLDAGVDVIGTDNLGALQEFLRARAAGGREVK